MKYQSLHNDNKFILISHLRTILLLNLLYVILTSTLSESMIVLRRCAMLRTVQSLNLVRSVFWISLSVLKKVNGIILNNWFLEDVEVMLQVYL